MKSAKLLALGASFALALAPGFARATSTFGTLGNFDTVNDTGQTAYGFEIDLDGLSSKDILDTFGGPGRGFPPTVERYGAPQIVDYAGGVSIIYQSPIVGGAFAVNTPFGVYATPGESCWTGGGIGYGPSTPCDHFGVSTLGNALKTTYSWLVPTAPGSTTLTKAASGAGVLAPVWKVTPAPPPPPGSPPAPPLVQAAVQAPDPEGGAAWGPAIWVKVFTTEVPGGVNLRQLVDDNGVIQQADLNTEIEWQLLQTEAGNPGSGLLESGDNQAANGDEAVLRRYVFYKYSGAYSPEGEALPVNGDTSPGPGELGAYIGDQNAGVDIGAAVAVANAVPEPATWAALLIGMFSVGALSRAKRSRAAGA